MHRDFLREHPPRNTRRLRGWAAALALGIACVLPGCGESDGPDAAASEADGIAFAVSHILIPIEKGRPPTTAEPLIRQAYRALEQGTDFATVARGRSKGGAAVDGGFLGFVPTEVDTAFAGAVQSLRPGQYSPPIRTSIGWQIIKRHGFNEARKLEQRYQIPTHGVFVAWDDPEHPRPQGATGRTKEEAYKLASEVLIKLGRGQLDFNQAMEMFTPPKEQRPEAYLGTTANRKGTRAMYDALKDAKVAALVGPVETAGGFAILMRGRYMRSLFRHILVQHTESEDRPLSIARTPEAALAIARTALREALADPSRWDELVGRYSDDRYSRPIGGRMGILHAGQMPRGFEAFAYEQKPGTIHPQVVQTPFGFHVVWKIN